MRKLLNHFVPLERRHISANKQTTGKCTHISTAPAPTSSFYERQLLYVDLSSLSLSVSLCLSLYK